jgi:hypothetical protein
MTQEEVALDLSLLEPLGKVAGIGGIALGVLLIVFRDIIGKKIFPKLPVAEAYRLLQLITAGVWSVAIVGIVAWVYASTPNAHKPPELDVKANCGGVAVGGNVTGTTITGGATTSSDCSTKSKQSAVP